MSSFSVPLVHAQGMHGDGVVASHPCNGMRCGRGHTATWTSGYSPAQNLYSLPEEAEC